LEPEARPHVSELPAVLEPLVNMVNPLKPELIGREEELSALERALEGVRDGRGGMLLLAGEAGVGKTRLAEAALTRSGLPVCTGRAVEEATPSYGPISAVLRACRRHAPEADWGPLTAYLALLLPELGPAPPETDRETLIEAVRAVLAATARARPLVVFLDDLQWADNGTLELVPALAERLSDEPLFILGTYRSDEIPRGHAIRRMRNELRRARRLEEVVLGPFGPEHTEALLGRLLEVAPAPGLVSMIHDRTQGLPLFIEELADTLVASGRLVPGEAGLALAPGPGLPVPDSVRDAVLLRLDGLTEEAHGLLEVAATVGKEFELSLVAELAGEEHGIEELTDRHLIVETASGRAAFRHELTREAIRGEIAWTRRRDLNRRIAERLESAGAPPAQVAEHWLAAHESDRARAALLAAAEQSCRVHAYRDAARAGHRALEMWPAGKEEDRRLDALERLAHCAQVSGQLNDAARAWREVAAALESGEDHPRRAEALRALATVQGLKGAWEQSSEAREAAARAFQKAGMLGETAAERLTAAGHLTALLKLKRAESTAWDAMQLARQADRSDVEARALGLLGVLAAMQGRFDEGRDTVQRGLSLALEHGLTEAASEVYRRLASVHEYASDYANAREAYFKAYDFCQAQGADVLAEVCLGCLSYTLFQTGDWKRAGPVCRDVIKSRTAPTGSRGVAVGMLGLIHAHRGEVAQARKLLEETLDVAREQEVLAMELLGGWGLALVEEQTGQLDAAEGRYRRLADRWRETQDRHDGIPVLAAAAAFFAGRGAESDAVRCAEGLASVATATGNREALAALARALGEIALAGGHLKEAVEQFDQALHHVESLEIPLDRATVEYRAGVAHARAGDRETAVKRLTSAHGIARKLGARPLASAIAGELEALGAPVKERRAAGGSTLTRRQVEVIRLMASGFTNKEIASRLYLSTRTVDMHVRDILNRLDCRSRTEAVRAADELGLLD